MQTIMTIFKDYGGSGYFSILFLLALIYLGFTEEDRRIKTLFVYIPAVILILFFLPPFYMLYNRLDEGTYYRILWLLPMTVKGEKLQLLPITAVGLTITGPPCPMYRP